MFLAKLKENNPALLDFGFYAHQNGLILPDTYLLDLDTITDNAQKILEEAKKNQVHLFFMLKQIGRNPIVAKRLMEIGYEGAVCVDFIEAITMIRNQIPIGNVGHLVQTPKAALPEILASHPRVVTVYSLEKIREINEAAERLNMVQPLLIRITDDDSELYSGQIAGFHSDRLEDVLKEIDSLDHVCFGGLTVFPALLYDAEQHAIVPTANMKAMNRARAVAEAYGLKDYVVNVPSANCCASMSLVHELGGNNAEPGHGLTGTTPLHAASNQPERVGYAYVTEVSHNYEDHAYCYGGGHYRRGHLASALVGTSSENAQLIPVSAPDNDSIDYHFELGRNAAVGDTAIMCFRTQIFVTRSRVAVVEGLSSGNPRIIGQFNHLGERED